jgi:basic membrane protein A
MSDNVDRRTFLAGTGAAGLATIAGCVGGTGSGDGEDPTNIGMVYALGGLGDNAFNDMANKGIEKAKEELGVQARGSEPSGASEFATVQQNYASSTDPTFELVCCIGFAQTSALEKNAEEYSDQKFMLVDSVLEKENVASYTFKEHQGSFQVGYLAGMMSTREFSHSDGDTEFKTNPDEKVVGFVGGKENPLIKKFEAGYIAGAKHADSDITVRSAYAGSWSNPQKGKEIAGSMYDAGADIVYHAAGGTGVGVFKAAQETGRLAIGVDSDQSQLKGTSNVVLASMVKHVDTAVFNAVKSITEDNFKGGDVVSLGLQKDGVEAVIGKDYEGEVPEEVTSALEESKKAIQNGEIEVPTDPKNA